jgi:hypothetical protein
MSDKDPGDKGAVLDPYAVLRVVAGTTAYVIVTFGPGSVAKGSVVAIDEAASVLLDHDGAASFVRHDAIQAVTVRDALVFGAELGLRTPTAPPPRLAEGAAVPTAPTVADPEAPALGLMELQSMLRGTGFDYDQAAVERADVIGRTGLATLASAVGAALQSIQADPAADAGMNADITDVRLADGPDSTVVIDGTTLVVTSPWSAGPAAVYDPAELRGDILTAAS